MNLLEVKNIKKSFDDLEVLKDISMSVAESEVISILGPSGSGKSTFAVLFGSYSIAATLAGISSFLLLKSIILYFCLFPPP